MYKPFLAAPVLIMVGMVIAAAAFSGRIEADRVYPLATVVTAIDESEDVVTVTDFNGDEWEFAGAEDWIVGDICALTMDNMGTDLIIDDEIINCKYCGWIGGITV